jgi:hypothetical protein
MENIGMMAIAVTTGSGLGISSDSAFMGLAQAAGMAVSGLAMFGGAKLDEAVANRQNGGHGKGSGNANGGRSARNDTYERAMNNVGRPETGSGSISGKAKSHGVAYRKNAGHGHNMTDADRAMKASLGRRHGMGVMSAKFFSAMVGGMTTDNLHNFDVLKGVGGSFKDVFSDKDFEGKDNSYPYSQEYFDKMKEKAGKQMQRAFEAAINNISGANLDGASGSEAVRQARINAGNMTGSPEKIDISNYDKN